MLSRLQADRHEVSDSLREQSLLAYFEFPFRERRQRLCQFGETAQGDYSAAFVGKLGNVIASLSLLQFFEKLRGKAFLNRGQRAAPLLRDKKDGAPRRQGGYQPFHKGLQAGHKVRGG